jgi:endonuclease/exonuclease/phosphatase family metal-dependent hydrolase
MARRGGCLPRAADALLLIVTLAGCAALALAYLSPVTDPNDFWLPAYAGLAFPILYPAVFLLALYWLIRWRGWFFVPLALLLVGAPKTGLYFRFSNDAPPAETGSDSLRVMTWNVEGFLEYDSRTGRSRSTAEEIIRYIRQADPDILCLQEFQSTPAVPEAVIDDRLAAWPYRRIGYSVSDVYGVAVYSKYPIAGSEYIRFEGGGNGVLRADLLVGGDTLRVICNHLESTYIKSDDIAFLRPENFTDAPDKGGRIRRIAGRLRRGFRARTAQADTIAALVASHGGPTVVCGDFNDTPMSYVYRTIRGGFADAFAERGRGYGFTYKSLYRLLRIDYILPSPHLHTLGYESPATEWSDHNPVIAVVSMTKSLFGEPVLDQKDD